MAHFLYLTENVLFSSFTKLEAEEKNNENSIFNRQWI